MSYPISLVEMFHVVFPVKLTKSTLGTDVTEMSSSLINVNGFRTQSNCNHILPVAGRYRNTCLGGGGRGGSIHP